MKSNLKIFLFSCGFVISLGMQSETGSHETGSQTTQAPTETETSPMSVRVRGLGGPISGVEIHTNHTLGEARKIIARALKKDRSKLRFVFGNEPATADDDSKLLAELLGPAGADLTVLISRTKEDEWQDKLEEVKKSLNQHPFNKACISKGYIFNTFIKNKEVEVVVSSRYEDVFKLRYDYEMILPEIAKEVIDLLSIIFNDSEDPGIEELGEASIIQICQSPAETYTLENRTIVLSRSFKLPKMKISKTESGNNYTEPLGDLTIETPTKGLYFSAACQIPAFIELMKRNTCKEEDKAKSIS